MYDVRESSFYLTKLSEFLKSAIDTEKNAVRYYV